jgi:transcriptional regulator with XRE-family HTH domain
MSVEIEFGARLRGRREARGLSLREAARIIEISLTRLVELEQGVSHHTGAPTRATRKVLERISRAYDVSLDVLLQEAGYPSSSPTTMAPDTARMVALYEGLSDGQQALALDFLRLLAAHGSRKG